MTVAVYLLVVVLIDDCLYGGLGTRMAFHYQYCTWRVRWIMYCPMGTIRCCCSCCLTMGTARYQIKGIWIWFRPFVWVIVVPNWKWIFVIMCISCWYTSVKFICFNPQFVVLFIVVLCCYSLLLFIVVVVVIIIVVSYVQYQVGVQFVRDTILNIMTTIAVLCSCINL